MALQDLQDQVAALEDATREEHAELQQLLSEAQELATEVATLQSQAAGGGSVSEADIDALTNRVASMLSAAQDAVAQAKAADPGSGGGAPPAPAPPAPAPTPEPPAPTPEPTPAPAPAPPAAEDRTLYTHDGDTSSINATVWPTAPFVTSDTPPAQLYFFAGDTDPGQRNGDGIDGVWHAYDGSPVPTDAGGVPVEASGDAGGTGAPADAEG